MLIRVQFLFCSSTSNLPTQLACRRPEQDFSDDSSDGDAAQLRLNESSADEDVLSGAEGDNESDEGMPEQQWLVWHIA